MDVLPRFLSDCDYIRTIYVARTALCLSNAFMLPWIMQSLDDDAGEKIETENFLGGSLNDAVY